MGTMETFEIIKKLGHEQVVFCQDQSIGYRAIIAIHSTALALLSVELGLAVCH